ncbi:MAG: hypothetical protein ACI9UR_002622 [Bacteroidia bacterium]|jgi:hypothetical protein
MIRYSIEESEFFGLKIGRADGANFEINSFKKEIEIQKFDVIRIRVDKADEHALNALHSLNFPLHHHSSIVKYELPVAGLSRSDYLNPEITLKVYDGKDSDSVRRIIKGGSAKDPIGYWSTPALGDFVNRDNEVEYLSEYYANLYVTPERQLWFMQWNGTPVGFVASNFNDGVMDTPLAVVLPEYRGKKLLHEIMISRNNYGINHGLDFITNGARVDNPASQHVFTKFGMRTTGIDKVFHIMPLLTKFG